MESTLLKRYLIKLLLGLLLIGDSMIAVSQSNNSTAKFKIKKSVPCKIELSGKYMGSSDSRKVSLLKIEDILADPVLRIVGCTDYIITYFEIATTVDGKAITMGINSDHLSNEMLNLIKQVKKGDLIIILDVNYKLLNGQTGVMPGINFRIN